MLTKIREKFTGWIAFAILALIGIPFLFLVFALGKREILVIRSKPTLVGLRAVLGALSLVTTFGAFSLMPMAETTVLLFTASLFIPVLGVIFLRESVGPYRWAAVVVGFAGVVIMTGPSGHVSALGITVAIAAALMHATLQIILRYLGRFERPETVTFYFLVIGTLITALPLPLVAVTPTLAESTRPAEMRWSTPSTTSSNSRPPMSAWSSMLNSTPRPVLAL